MLTRAFTSLGQALGLDWAQSTAARISTGDVFDVGAGITKPFAFGTVLSASLSGQRSTRSIVDSTLGGSGPGYSLLG